MRHCHKKMLSIYLLICILDFIYKDLKCKKMFLSTQKSSLKYDKSAAK